MATSSRGLTVQRPC